MVTIEQLQAQRERLLKKRSKAQEKGNILSQKIELEKEIKILERSPSTSRNIILAKRTGRGLKILGKKLGSATIRQFKRIKEQQQRDEAALRKSGKKVKKETSNVGQVIITKTITGKGKKRKVTTSKRFQKLKTGQKLSKIKEKKGVDIFANLDF